MRYLTENQHVGQIDSLAGYKGYHRGDGRQRNGNHDHECLERNRCRHEADNENREREYTIQ